MNNGLCVHCRRWLENEYGTMELEPWEHCHHEPDNPPKEKCWCEREHKVGKAYSFEGNMTKTWDVLFCPHCARRL